MKRQFFAISLIFILIACSLFPTSALHPTETPNSNSLSISEYCFSNRSETEKTISNLNLNDFDNIVDTVALSATNPIDINAADSDISGVTGIDDRVLVSNTKEFPYSAIVYLSIDWGLGKTDGRATGFLISDDVVLTAAHVLYNPEKGGWPISVKAYPAKNGNGLFDNPYGGSFSKKTGVCTVWKNAKDSGLKDTETQSTIRNNDWGAIKLIRSLGNKTGYIELRCPSNEELENRRITISGYPVYVYGNTSSPVYQQYKASGYVSSYTSNLIYCQGLDSSGGQSGSPMLSEDNIAYGIYTGLTNGINRGVRITEIILYYLNTLMIN